MASRCTRRQNVCNFPLSSRRFLIPKPNLAASTVYPKKYAHGFVVLCFVVVMQSFIMNSHEVFIHIHQGCFAGTGTIVRLPQCQWSKPDGYGKISQCITTTKHSKAKTVCIFLGIYCMWDRVHMKTPINVMLSPNRIIARFYSIPFIAKQKKLHKCPPLWECCGRAEYGNRNRW